MNDDIISTVRDRTISLVAVVRWGLRRLGGESPSKYALGIDFSSRISVSIFEKPRTYIDSRVQALTMKKILAISTLAIAALMLTPMGIGPVTSLFNFNYAPNLSYVQLGPLTTLPQGIPLCKSTSLGNIVCYTPSFIKKAYEYPSTATL